MELPTFEIEKNLIQKGFVSILGMDEAGRGPIAGPLVCAGILFKMNLKSFFESDLIRDSKTLSEKQREKAFKQLGDKKIQGVYSVINNNYIDEKGITKSLEKGYELVKSKIKHDYILLDGNVSYGLERNHQTVIKGDSVSKVIAAASIVAKYIRDQIMIKENRKYPEYGFHSHKGYGTKEHFSMIEKNGICQIHRISFLKNRFKSESLP